MAGVQNTTARAIDLRGRRPGVRGDRAICTVTLNPGFNVVDDEELKLCMANKLNQTLLDNKVIVVGAIMTRQDAALLSDVRRAAEEDALIRPRAVASLTPNVDRADTHGAGAQYGAMDEPGADLLSLN